MSRLTTGLAMLTALLVGGLVAVPAQAESKPPAKAAGVLHVYGNADTKLFTEEGIKRAEATMHGTQFDHGLMVTVDTYVEVPADKKAGADAAKRNEASWHKFLENWVKERAQSDKSKGIYILICRNQWWIAVIADRETRERGFSDADEKEVWTKLRKALSEAGKEMDPTKKLETRDDGLNAAVDYIVSKLKDSHVATPASVKNDTKKSAGMGVGGWICLGLCILLGVWLVIGLIRALTGGGGGYGGGGYGGGGGGGFGSSLLGGLFGAMAGMWLYNNMFGGHTGMMGGSDAFAGDSGMGADADTGAGDYSGEDGATGGYDQAATPEAAAIGAVAEETLVEVVATLGAAVTSAVISSLSGQHEKPTRTRVGFSVSTAYHDHMPTDPNCPMCQTVAELERDAPC